MSIWLDPWGKTTYGIGICDRCRRKFSLDDLQPDPNSPGLRVCKDDADVIDPYRLPPRVPENITLAFVRPDADLSPGQEGAITEDGDGFIVLEEGGGYLLY
mgnify:FL=1